MINRRRQMEDTLNRLPTGYTRLEELSVVSGNKYIDTGALTTPSKKYKFVTKIKYYSISGSLRQLCGCEFEPWWGCDKGKFNYSGNLTPAIPEKNTILSTDTWYNVEVIIPAVNNGSQRILLFTLNNRGTTLAPRNIYQCQMAFKDFCDIYEESTLIRHLIPCKNSNNEEGMYDTIKREFHALTSY